MELSTRLAALAKFVPQGSCVIDVGTDHAYIPIYLVKHQIAKTCLATDINAGPLKKAKHNIERHGAMHIELKQTNGLEGIEVGKGNVIMISGMGGYLVIDILSRAKELVASVDKLILQPQQDIKEVRKYLHEIGFKIEEEDFVKDDDKYYTVIVATHGKEHYDKESDYIYGKKLIEKGLPLFKEWLTIKDEKLTSIYESIKDKQSESIDQRKQQLEEELKMHKEVMSCLI